MRKHTCSIQRHTHAFSNSQSIFSSCFLEVRQSISQSDLIVIRFRKQPQAANIKQNTYALFDKTREKIFFSTIKKQIRCVWLKVWYDRECFKKLFNSQHLDNMFDILNLTFDFLLLNEKIFNSPFFCGLPKLAVLEYIGSTKMTEKSHRRELDAV